MTWDDALSCLEDGFSVRRTDWGFPDTMYIELETHNDALHFYKVGHLPDVKQCEGYGLSYADIKSNCWEEQ